MGPFSSRQPDGFRGAGYGADTTAKAFVGFYKGFFAVHFDSLKNAPFLAETASLA
jgi:hypothetical protein